MDDLEKLLENFSIDALLRSGTIKAENFVRLLRIECWGKDIEPASISHPWNGWEVDETGFATFRAGAMLEAWEHLRKCEKCRTINNISPIVVEAAVKALMWAWREAVG